MTFMYPFFVEFITSPLAGGHFLISLWNLFLLRAMIGLSKILFGFISKLIRSPAEVLYDDFFVRSIVFTLRKSVLLKVFEVYSCFRELHETVVTFLAALIFTVIFPLAA